jgi:hypothetical protein
MRALKTLYKRLEAVSNHVQVQTAEDQDKALAESVKALSDEELDRLIWEPISGPSEYDGMSYQELLQLFADLYERPN